MDADAMKRFALERVEALFNRGESTGWRSSSPPDFVNHEAWPGEDPGYEGFKLRLRRLHDAISDLRMEVHEVIAEGDLVAYRATLSGRHTGALLGIPPTNGSFGVQHMHMLRIRTGRHRSTGRPGTTSGCSSSSA